MSVLSQIPDRDPVRRGELDATLHPDARAALREMYLELRTLQRRAAMLNDEFLSFLIAGAADEARDQLRDDFTMREREIEETLRDLPGGG